MNTVLSFMDKIYSDSTTLSTIYIIGAILLFMFIVLLIFSLRKPNENKQKIIEEPVIDDTKEDNNDMKEMEVSKEETKVDIKDEIIEKTSEIKQQTNLSDILEKVEETKIEEVKEDKTRIDESKLAADIPNVDEYVDNIVKKTYEKNEQFSSVYVGNNTSSIKLDKVLDKLNVDEDIKEEIVPEEEKTNKLEETIENRTSSLDNLKQALEEKIIESKENDLDSLKDTLEKKKTESKENSLDNLKLSLEEKKKEMDLKQDDLKKKLEMLKQSK